ncbi:oligosaccharide flippase family protein [Methanobacterium oryzae]|uniref:oligosaccharide flippase family protein n=1 Tax=Methanobacterium oryzae TaxID=69540 RepID=UPI003D25139C
MKIKTKIGSLIRKLILEIELDFLKNVSITFFSQILILITGFVLSVVIARYLGPSGKGILAFLATITSIGLQLSNLGLHASNTYYVSKDKSFLPRLARNSIFSSILFGFMVILILYSFYLLKPEFFANISPILFVITLLAIPFQLLFLFYSNLLLGIQKIKEYNYLLLINNVLSNLIIIVIVLFGLGLLDIVLFQFFFALIIAIGMIVFLKFNRELKDVTYSENLPFYKMKESMVKYLYQFKPDFELLKTTSRYGFKIYLAALFSFLVLRSDIILVNYFLGSAATGIYSIAVSFGDLIYLIPVTVASILFPKVSNMEKGGWEFTWGLIKKGAVLMAVISILFLFLTKPLIIFLYGTPFIGASWAFLFLLPGVYFLSLETVAVQYLAARGFPIFVVYAWVLALTVNIVLNIILLPKLGINGASISSTIAYILITALVLFFIFKLKKA